MHDLNVFAAINRSQDNEPLAKWLTRHRIVMDDLRWSWSDALNALLVLSYQEADDPDELESHLHYAKRQIEDALAAVQREATNG